MQKNKKEIEEEIKQIQRKIAEITEEISKQYDHIDDSQWEIPGLKEAEMRKAIYEKRLLTLQQLLKKE